MVVQLDPGESDSRCFFLAALGVDVTSQGRDVALRLIHVARGLMRMRMQRGKNYVAEMATTVHDRDGRLAELLSRIGFQPLPLNSLLWYRRIRELPPY
jgi:hypothetical protein